MRFLEKNLEDILYHELAFCRERGLCIEPMETKVCRQLNLMPFGIADLVHFGYQTATGRLHVRIIECKRDVVNAATYTQASRYQVAINRILGVRGVEDPCYEKVLIGQKADPKNDFWALVDNDPNCDVYTYDYQGDGIRFKRHHSFVELDCLTHEEMHQPTVENIFSWAEKTEARIAERALLY